MTEKTETKKYNAALVIGKFYPFHRGHIHLIDEAISSTVCGDVYVLVMGSDFESISMATRIDWIKDYYKRIGQNRVQVMGITVNAPVGYGSDSLWAAHSAAIIQAAGTPLKRSIEAVFTSEQYGDRLSSVLSSYAGRPIAHVCVDIERKNVPISGTAIRSDLDANWRFLPEVVRRSLSVKVAVVGAESTGTTTLTESLRKHYSSRFSDIYPVNEYGREYTYQKFNDLKAVRASYGKTTAYSDLKWNHSDFNKIAARQAELQKIAEVVSPLAIYDTDEYATSIWRGHYLEDADSGAVPLGNTRKVDLYLVTDTSIPFVNDSWRDGDLEARYKMTETFLRGLTRTGRTWVLISGPDHEERLENSVKVIDELIKMKHTFYSPPWADVTKLD